MAKSIVQHTDGDLFMRQRIDDGYINLNDIARSTNKRVDNWLRLEQTKELLEEFKVQSIIPQIRGNLDRAVTKELLEEFKVQSIIPIVATRGKNGGTWAHPEIAIQFAQWCSPAFALWCSRIIFDYMTNGAGNPLWHVQRQKIKDSNEQLRDAIAAYVERHKDELSENRKKFVYNNVNDKLAIALVGCRPAKFRRDKNATSFRDALTKEELALLERLEELATRLINQKDIDPLIAIPEAKERLLI